MRPETFRPLSLAALTTTMLLVAARPPESRASIAETGPTLILRVDDDAPAGGDGATWETAFRFLQDALAAASGETEIRVAQGLYEPDRREADPDGTGDRFASFVLLNGLRVIGGHAGLNTADPDERDSDRFPTILSGDLARNDEPDFGRREDNSAHVAVANDADETAGLEGCILRGGQGNDRGGGALRLDDSTLRVIECHFTDNYAESRGGAVSISRGAPRFDSCSFEDNAALLEGGAVYEYSLDEPLFDRCEFRRNEAQTFDGGAVCAQGSRFRDCIFEDNVTRQSGGALETGSSVVEGCVFRANEAGGGGAVRAGGATSLLACEFRENTAGFGGALLVSGQVVVAACIFVENCGDAGGAAGVLSGAPLLFDCRFTGNSATEAGGAISMNRGDVEVRYCTFEENSAPYGGAMSVLRRPFFPAGATVDRCDFSSNTATVSGGAMNVGLGAEAEILWSTFTGNSAVFAGGAVNVEGSAPVIDECDFTDNAVHPLAGIGGAIAAEDGSAPCVTDCDFTGNHAGGGGAIASYFHSTVYAVDCSFETNAALTGGALHGFASGDLDLLDCHFYHNESEGDGGVLWSRESTSRFRRTLFDENFSGGDGGAAYLWASDAHFDDTAFRTNEANLGGGAIYLRDAHATAASCEFSENVGRHQPGAAVAREGDSGSLRLTECWLAGHEDSAAIVELPRGGASRIEGTTFIGNALLMEHAAVVSGSSGGADLIIVDSRFVQQPGVALSVRSGDARISNCEFEAELELAGATAAVEHCTFDGSRVEVIRGEVTLRDCDLDGTLLFVNDEATLVTSDSSFYDSSLRSEGVVFVTGCQFIMASTGIAVGGAASRSLVANCVFAENMRAIDLGRGDHDFRNCTLFGNEVGFRIADDDPQSIIFRNTVFWESPSVDQDADIALFFCDFEGGWAGAGRGNIDSDPLIPGAGNYRPLPLSPCIDTGWDDAVALDATDRDGDGDLAEFDDRDHAGSPRFVDNADTLNGPCGVVDIGAYELRDGTRQTRVAGDVDRNGRVGAADLLALLVAWGDTDSCDADVDADGVVGYADFLMVLARWVAT